MKKIFLFIYLFFSSAFSLSLHAETISEVKRSEEQIRQEMIEWSEQLGVTCTECHNPKNFKDNSMKNFKIGLEHGQIVSLLKDHGFDGSKGAKASCTMCHHGLLKPNLKIDSKLLKSH